MDIILMNDGNCLHDEQDVITLFNSLGIHHESDFRTIYEILGEMFQKEDELRCYIDKANEYEMIADEYKQNMDGLCDEIYAVSDKLLSGKRGANYTKNYLGNALLNAIHQYQI